MDALMQRLMGNGALVKIFVNKFIMDSNFTLLLEAFAKQDMKQAEVASHTLKGMCGNMSLTRLFDLFTQQVNLLRLGQYEKAQVMMNEIEPAFREAIFYMKEWLADN